MENTHTTLLSPETEPSRIAIAQRIVQEVGIPTQPKLLMDINRLAANPDVDFDQISDLIRKDVGLSAKVLKLASSPLFHGGTSFESVTQALMVLGFQNFKRCILTAATEKALSGNGYDIKKFWFHSTVVGALCQKLADRYLPEYGDAAYTVGLFHDVGTIVLGRYNEQYSRVSDQALALDFRNLLDEYSEYGSDHGSIGRIFSQKWALSPMIAEVIQYHHEPDYTVHAKPEVQMLKAILQLAEMLYMFGMNQGILGLAPNRQTQEVLNQIRYLLSIDDAELDQTKAFFKEVLRDQF